MTDDPTISLGGVPASNPAANPAPPPPPPLLTVWGPFELLSRAGAGGFGEVYRAWDPHLQREIALKLLLPNAVAGEEAWQAMLREARALASVRHPNIVPVYGIDRHQERVGFWTDYIRGKTLAAIVREQGPFGYREAALMGIDICRALAAVHAAGLLHRDIKPENVMREEGGRILLMDFGLSTLPHAGASLAGTQSFMAPELFRGAPATVASDLYAVGILLYFLVSGAHPARLTGLSAREATEAIAHRKPLIDLRPDLPDTFIRVVSTALEIDPTCRYQSAGQLAEALTSSLNSSITSTHAVFHPEAPTSSLPYGTQPGFQTITPSHTPSYTPQTTPVGSPSTNAAPPPHNFRAALEATATEALITATSKVKTIQWTKKKIGLVLLASWLIYKAFFGCESSSRSKSDEDDEKAAKIAAAAAAGALHIPRPPTPTGPAYTRFVQAQGLLEQSYKQANITAALSQFQKLTDDDDDFALGWAGLAAAHFDLYQTERDPKLLDKASTEANKAIEIDDECVPALITLARIAAQEGNNALAIGTAGKAIGLDPTNPEAHAALAQAKANEGRYDEAAKTMQEAIDRAPDDWRFPSALGDIYMRAGKLDDAQKQYAASARLAPDNASAYYNLGKVDMRLNKLDDAEDNILHAAQIEPTAGTYEELAWLDLAKGDTHGAIEADKRAVALDPGNYKTWANMGAAFVSVAESDPRAIEPYRHAIELAEKAREKEPKNADLLASLGYYYVRVGDKDRGRTLMRQALALSPGDPKVLYVSGETSELLGDRAQAIDLIARSVGPGYSAAEMQRDPDLAQLRKDPVFQQKIQAAAKAHGQN